MELEARRQRAIDRRFKCARLQVQPSIYALHFHHHKSRVQAKNRILRLLDLTFLRQGTNIVLIGNPGVGKTDRQRFRSAAEVQCYVGIAPVTSSSGKSRWVHLRWSCPKFLRQTFHEYAACSLRKSLWAKAYYRHLREKGYGHHAAVRALAFKWIRIVFRCWKDGQLYDEATYLQSLQRKNSPVVATLEVAALPARVPQWKQIAGFSKLT
jgi:transposase